jgi:hypothetical protein
MIELGQVNFEPSLNRETMESLYSILDLCQEPADFDVRISILHEICERQEYLITLVPRLIERLPVLCMSAIWAYLKEYSVPGVTTKMIYTAFERYGYYMHNDCHGITVEYFKQQTERVTYPTWPIKSPYDYTTLDRRGSVLGMLVQKEIDKGKK